MNNKKDSRFIFAENLRRILKQKGYDQVDLANYMGVSSSTASDWCNGKKYPRVDKVQRLADWLEVLKSDLTEEKFVAAVNANDELILKTFQKLNSENQRKILELARLYAADQEQE
ncbi:MULTISPECIES: helix-turn-helix domain-containing protein [Caproicibacterium]|uniref:Helix-turn-helix transcriptional regulator n=1 Tax=Caproicibacterium argilliputei TaxID=3030016 RepID=A0AA97D8Y6_9FIRM|nr:helix-turn-helix transcriptional regulator [Caproicibacterium argilliputei]WOC31657.1 helix-turn-helix transcriptional regulator [Caproicibacterium argilliputei]